VTFMKHLALRLVLVLTLAFVAVPVSAAPVRESLSGEAAAKFDEGSRLYRTSAYGPAREAFLASFAKSGDPRILFNVAVCDKALGRYARAIATLRRSLAGADRPLPADYTQKAAEAIATLSRYVAFVTVEVDASATTTVDGDKLQENPVPLETGAHTLVAAKDGFETASKTITVKAGETARVELVLEPSRKPGSAVITCAGIESCDVFVDGESLGKAPVTLTRPAGTYVVRATHLGQPFAEQRVEIQNGKGITLALGGSSASRPLAKLRVTTGRLDDTIRVDGTVIGKSGRDLEVGSGEHVVVIERDGTSVQSLDLLLRDNETRDVRVTIPEKDRRSGGGPSPWWYVGGGVAVVGLTALTVFLVTRPTTFEGSSAGTLNPYVVPASREIR
jgi:hypothetical protein